MFRIFGIRKLVMQGESDKRKIAEAFPVPVSQGAVLCAHLAQGKPGRINSFCRDAVYAIQDMIVNLKPR
jgi:hypothetical protein